MNDNQNNQDFLGHDPKFFTGLLDIFIRLVHFLCALIFLFNIGTLFLKLLFNIGVFYRAEQLAWSTLMAGFADQKSAALVPVILASWPIAVCILAFIVVIAGATIFILFDPINTLKRKIAALEALCPDWFGSSPLPTWSAWLNCRMELNTLRAELLAIVGVFAVAAVVTLINIIVLF